MPYDRPRKHVYMFDAADFSTADRAIILKNPFKGSKGKVLSVDAMIKTAGAGDTTPIVKVGTTIGGAEFASIPLGTAAAGTVVSSREYGYVISTGTTGVATSAFATTTGILGLKKTYTISNGAGTWSDHVVTTADSDVYVTLVASTGGTAAGVADVKIEVDWQ